MFRAPRREDHTIWTAVAANEVFTVRTYTTTRDYEPSPNAEISRSPLANLQVKRYDQADPATVIKIRYRQARSGHGH